MASLDTDDRKGTGSDADSDLENDDITGGEGRDCAVKNVYEGKSACRCCINWVDEYPDDLKQANLAADKTPESKRHAILVRNKRSHGGPKALEIHDIVVQSSILKSLLKDIIGKYPGVTFEAKEVVFSKPFEPLFHNWATIRGASKNHEDEEAQAYLKLLVQTLKEMKYTLQSYRDLVSHSVITFDLLWAIFKPGDDVIEHGESNNRIYRLIRTEYDSEGKIFNLKCRYVDWDGTKFGYGSVVKEIKAFKGPKTITGLSLYPKSYTEKLDHLEQEILDRGRRFQALAGCHYREYSGNAVEPRSFFSFYAGERPVFIDGRVVVDAEAFFQYNPDCKLSLSRIQFDENSDDKAQSVNFLRKEDLLLCVPHVRGYSLKRKKWVQLLVNDISPIDWNCDAFARLILPKQYKNILYSIVASKLGQSEGFDDIIQGKGQGVIMLLSGDPGVGKTLTAESVAEQMHKPLYMVTAGELGSKVDDVEQALGKVLELAARWNAVLLLDEADVFMEQRSNHEIERNKLVSIFLRTLEYFTGILLITTNRQSSIDKAFKSRIDLSLHYPPLSHNTQKEIWIDFISRSSSKASDFTDDDWAVFTKRSMNGREIKNAVKLAHLLANRQGVPLAPCHVNEVLEALHNDLWVEFQQQSHLKDIASVVASISRRFWF
ncbi:P-loop containing nucleoside triphosphate hydrolase protein [Hyaloscypha hepaticicola]|uniref:P-loop containing nucleoside triphosphate hydrolase protein n=1 Tax=Hyaloscypha hepaticicola TaxID=2082293 RepID=A0A2J6PZL6_9HELO|nr:P-loop containing nucleoside triphosphate hydrolase protein [Hyaloscypha hepaticicola]